MLHTEETQVLDLEEKLKDITKRYELIKMIAIALGVLAILLLGWTLYTALFSKTNEALSANDLEQNQYVIELKDSIYKLNYELTDLETNAPSTAENTETITDGSLEDEIVYSIQIGAFEQKDLSLYSENFTNFKEIKQGGFNKYSIGNFENLYEAQEFLTEINALGFPDAFIASYANGERLKIEEAY